MSSAVVADGLISLAVVMALALLTAGISLVMLTREPANPRIATGRGVSRAVVEQCFHGLMGRLFSLASVFDLADILFVAGAAAIVAGFAQFGLAPGLMSLGVFLLLFGILISLRSPPGSA